MTREELNNTHWREISHAAWECYYLATFRCLEHPDLRMVVKTLRNEAGFATGRSYKRYIYKDKRYSKVDDFLNAINDGGAEKV